MFASAAAAQVDRDHLTQAVGNKKGRKVIEAVHVGRKTVNGEHQRCIRLAKALGMYPPRCEVEIEFHRHEDQASRLISTTTSRSVDPSPE